MKQSTTEKIRWTIADVDLLAADEWKRYELIDGELFRLCKRALYPSSSKAF